MKWRQSKRTLFAERLVGAAFWPEVCLVRRTTRCRPSRKADPCSAQRDFAYVPRLCGNSGHARKSGTRRHLGALTDHLRVEFHHNNTSAGCEICGLTHLDMALETFHTGSAQSGPSLHQESKLASIQLGTGGNHGTSGDSRRAVPSSSRLPLMPGRHRRNKLLIYNLAFLALLILYGRWVYYDAMCREGYGTEQHNSGCREKPFLVPASRAPRLPKG